MTHPELHGTPASRFSELSERQTQQKKRGLLIGVVVAVVMIAALVGFWSIL